MHNSNFKTLLTTFLLTVVLVIVAAVPAVVAQRATEYRRVPIAPPDPKLVALAQAAQAALYTGQYALAEYDARKSTFAGSSGDGQGDLDRCKRIECKRNCRTRLYY